MIPQSQLDHWQELCDRATPPEAWALGFIWGGSDEEPIRAIVRATGTGQVDMFSDDDVDFIAEAGAALPLLLAEIKEMRSRKNRIDLAEISRQRALNWPDIHPEDYCHQCGGRNAGSWWTDQWNKVMRSNGETIVCPPCFVARAEEAGIKGTWELRLDIETPPTNDEIERHRARLQKALREIAKHDCAKEGGCTTLVAKAEVALKETK